MVEECKTIFIYEDHEGREYMRKCARQKHENDNHKIKRIGMSANAYYTKPEGYKRKTKMNKKCKICDNQVPLEKCQMCLGDVCLKCIKSFKPDICSDCIDKT